MRHYVLLAAFATLIGAIVGCGGSSADPTATITSSATTQSPPIATTATSIAVTDQLQVNPAKVVFDPDIATVEINAIPTAPPSDIFANPNQAAYDEQQGLAPDARRILDLGALQLSIEQFHAANGHYPDALNELFPAFAPLDQQDQPLTQPPTDPVSHQPYAYVPNSDHQAFQLTALMDNGASYTVSGP